MKVSELIRNLQEWHSPDDEVAVAIWVVDDVLNQANESGQVITENEATEILKIVDRMHDASIGINWDNIDCHIDMFVTDRK